MNFRIRIKREGEDSRDFPNIDPQALVMQVSLWMADADAIEWISMHREAPVEPRPRSITPGEQATWTATLWENRDIVKYALRLTGALQDEANGAMSDRAADLYRDLWGEDFGELTFRRSVLMRDRKDDPNIMAMDLARIIPDYSEDIQQLGSANERAADGVAQAIQELASAVLEVGKAIEGHG